MQDFSLWHVGFSSLTRDLNPGPLHWELRVLASGPPGKSLIILFYSILFYSILFYSILFYSILHLCLVSFFPRNIKRTFISISFSLSRLSWSQVWALSFPVELSNTTKKQMSLSSDRKGKRKWPAELAKRAHSRCEVLESVQYSFQTLLTILSLNLPFRTHQCLR